MTSPLTKRFGCRAREIRNECGRRLDDVRRAGGACSNARLSLLERGRISPTLRTVEDLARALSTEPLDFFVEPTSCRRHQLIAASRNARPSGLTRALAALRSQGTPNRDLLEKRIARLPQSMRQATREALRLVDHPKRRAHASIADALADLRPSELTLADDVVTAFEAVLAYGDESATIST